MCIVLKTHSHQAESAVSQPCQRPAQPHTDQSDLYCRRSAWTPPPDRAERRVGARLSRAPDVAGCV